MSLASEVLSLAYFFIPAYVANMAAVYSRRFNILNYPLDFGLKIRKERIFGDNKTWRGMVFGVLVGQIAFLIQFLLDSIVDVAILNTHLGLPLWLGALMSVGAILGDAIESCVKRRIRIGPGQKLVVWDQIDFLLGAALVSFAFWQSGILAFIILLALALVVTMIIQRIAYVIGIKDDPL